jgi:hypothetical protein
MAELPRYSRKFGFADHSVSNPTTPHPGQKLDQEFDRLAAWIVAATASLRELQRADGELMNATVGPDQLKPGVLEYLADQVREIIALDIQRVNSLVELAGDHRAGAERAVGAIKVNQAEAIQRSGEAVHAAALSNRDAERAGSAALRASTDALDAQLDANRAEDNANKAAIHEALARDFAEKLEGPVMLLPPDATYNEANDQALWSSKWWAVYTQNLLAEFNVWYLGAFPTPPTQTPSGDALAPGMIYYDTSTELLYFYDGSQWFSLERRNWLVANNLTNYATDPTAIANAIAAGDDAQALGDEAIAIGNGAYAKSFNNVIIGGYAYADGAGAYESVALGFGAELFDAPYGTSLGAYAYTYAPEGVAVGYACGVGGQRGTAIGANAWAGMEYGIAVGYGSLVAPVGHYLYDESKIKLLTDTVGLRVTEAGDVEKTLDGGSVWVPVAAGSGGGIEEAPIDSNEYVRKNAGWVQTAYFSGDYNDLTNIPPGELVDPGNLTNQTLRWDGTRWVRNPYLESYDTGTLYIGRFATDPGLLVAVGQGRNPDGFAHFDLHGAATSKLRMARKAGVNGDAEITNDGSGDLLIGTGGKIDMRVDAFGGVVIGDYAHRERNLEIHAPGGTGALGRPSLQFVNHTVDDYACNIEFFNDTVRAGYIAVAGTSGTLALANETLGSDVVFSTESTVRMRIEASGRVGINETDMSASGANAQLAIGTGYLNFTDGYGVVWGGGSGRPALIGNKSTGTIYFSGADVGVNTNSPGAKLEVVGSGSDPACIITGDTGPGLEIGVHSVNAESDIALQANAAIVGEDSISYAVDASGYHRWMTGATNRRTGIAGATEQMRIDSTGVLDVATAVQIGAGDTRIEQHTGNYGSLNITNHASGGYYGISLNGWLNLMKSTGQTGSGGLYNDDQNHWVVRYAPNQGTFLHYAGSERLETTSNGVDIAGSITVSGNITKPGSSGDFNVNSEGVLDAWEVVAGRGNGSVGLTINDSQGNANVTFNHVNGVPDISGSSARIAVTVDSATAIMSFELANSVTAGVSVNTPVVATMAANGDFTATGDVTAFSDVRHKTNIETIPYALDAVLKMRGVRFDRKDTGSRGCGVIAQEMQGIVPEVVKSNDDGVLSVAYGNLVGYLIEAVKELNAKVEALS